MTIKWKFINHDELNHPLSVTDDMLKEWESEYMERDKKNEELRNNLYNLHKI